MTGESIRKRILPSTNVHTSVDETWQPANVHAASVLVIGAIVAGCGHRRVTVTAERSLSTWPAPGKQKIIIIMQVSRAAWACLTVAWSADRNDCREF